MAENITVPVTYEQVWQAWHDTTQPWGGCADREAVDRVMALILPAKCVMTHKEPFDFAQCETHDTTFPLGETCKFDGREPWQVYADEADEQRGLKVRAEMSLDQREAAASALVALSQWIDSGNAHRDPEAVTWGRLAKIGEEHGEVIEAYIGATGQNPRKGTTHGIEDVVEELLDVAVTALGAIEHLSEHRGYALEMLQNKILRVTSRALANREQEADRG